MGVQNGTDLEKQSLTLCTACAGMCLDRAKQVALQSIASRMERVSRAIGPSDRGIDLAISLSIVNARNVNLATDTQ